MIIFLQGFVTVVQSLRPFVPAIYDCTYAVPKSEASPTLLRIFKGISCLVSQLKTLTKAKLDKIHNAIAVPLIQNKLFYLIQILLLLFVYNYLRIILFKRKICCKQIEYLIILVFAQVVSPWVACLWILPVDLTPLILGRHLIYGAFPAPGHSYYWNPHSFVSIREFKTPYGFTNTRPHEAEASSDMS